MYILLNFPKLQIFITYFNIHHLFYIILLAQLIFMQYNLKKNARHFHGNMIKLVNDVNINQKSDISSSC